MAIELLQSKKLDTHVVKYLKGSTLEDGTAALHEFVQCNPTEKSPKIIVVDATDADVTGLNFEKLSAETSKKVIDLAAFNKCQKMALVARNDVQFGFLRMYEVIAFEKLGFETGVFSNDAEALAFAGLPFTTIDALVAAIGKETLS